MRTSVFCSTFAASYLLQTIMANILKSFFSQCARPEGALGRVMLSFMNYTHAPLTNWGLKLVDVQDGWTMLDVGCGGGFTIRRLLKAASKQGQSQTRLSFAER